MDLEQTNPRQVALRRGAALRHSYDLLLLTGVALLLPALPLLEVPLLRVPLGLAAALLAPGYALSAALFPGRADLGGVTRAALSFGLSVAVLPVLALALSVLPWGIYPGPMSLSLSAWIVLLSGVTLWRRRMLAFGAAFEPPVIRPLVWWSGLSQRARMRYAVAVLAFTGVLAGMLFSLLAPDPSARLTEFYALGSEGLAENYPREVTYGQEAQVRLGIRNREGAAMHYRIEIRSENRLLAQTGPLPLGDGASWEGPVSYAPAAVGNDQQIDVLLFNGDESEPYRRLRLWLNVRPRPGGPQAGPSFPLGVFEDASMVDGNAARFETMTNDLRAHGLDSLMFANNFANRDAAMLAVSDRQDFNVFMLPGGDLNDNWWPSGVAADIDTARRVAQPIVDLFGPHPSFKGYIVKDEPGLGDWSKVVLMTRAFHELDPARPAMPILIGVDRAGPIFTAAQPDVMLIDVYPAGYNNPPCDFTMSGFGYGSLDFVGYIRAVTKGKAPGVPLWVILQTHRFGTGGPFSLREPLPTEVRAQQWLAIGEGATGIFWFVYSSQQGWTGLADNPTLYAEVTHLARRVGPLRSLLTGLRKAEDQFTVAGADDPYVSTLASAGGQKTYAVAVNRDCVHPQMLSINSFALTGQLRDVESGKHYAMGQPIEFQPGDGRVFELDTTVCTCGARCGVKFVYLPMCQN